MTIAARYPISYPHIRFREVNGRQEAYVLDTGLGVWEIAWLARTYGPDPVQIAEHTGAERDLIAEGLDYAAEHAMDVAAEISRHTELSLSEIRALLPGLTVVSLDDHATA